MWLLAVDLPHLVRGCCNSETLRHLSISEPLAVSTYSCKPFLTDVHWIVHCLYGGPLYHMLKSCIILTHQVTRFTGNGGFMPHVSTCSMCFPLLIILRCSPSGSCGSGLGFATIPEGFPEGSARGSGHHGGVHRRGYRNHPLGRGVLEYWMVDDGMVVCRCNESIGNELCLCEHYILTVS